MRIGFRSIVGSGKGLEDYMDGFNLTARTKKLNKKTTYWYCDTCDDLIENDEDGYVEWIMYRTPDGASKGRDLRLVHHVCAPPGRRRCQFNSDVEFARDQGVVHDIALPELLGPDGLARLLEILQRGVLSTQDVAEMIRRLHIPGFEEARRWVSDGKADGILEPCAGDPLLQSDISELLNTYVN
jgi:hypothetical protein